MRDPDRIERILTSVEEIWKKYPDLRLTQLIMNVLMIHGDPYYIDDDELEKRLVEYKNNI